MRYLKVAGAALNQTPLDWAGNRAHIVEAIRQAKAAGVQVLCLPELCISGYGCEDAFHAPGLQRTALDVLGQVVPATGGMAVCVGLPLLYKNALFSVACLAVDGRIAGFVAKQFLAGEGLHYEPSQAVSKRLRLKAIVLEKVASQTLMWIEELNEILAVQE